MAAMEVQHSSQYRHCQEDEEDASKNGWALTELEMYNIPRLIQNWLEMEQQHQQQQELQQELQRRIQQDQASPGLLLQAEADKARRRRGRVCILSIDGGGMRGIIAGKVLAHLENLLQAKSGDPAARIVDYFDLAAGTNVGGIIATMLFTGGGSGGAATPLLTADEAWKFIAEKGKDIFGRSSGDTSGDGATAKKRKKGGGFGRLLLCGGGGSGGGEEEEQEEAQDTNAMKPTRSSEALERSLREILGDGRRSRPLTLRDAIKPLLVPCYDLATAAPFLFSRACALQSSAWDFALADVCAAAAATPGVFAPADVASVDGTTRLCAAVDAGMVMNSPAAAALTHVLHNAAEFPGAGEPGDVLLLSLGTGQFVGRRKGAAAASEVVLDNVSDMVDQMLALAFGGASRRESYLRLQVVVPDGRFAEMDDGGEANVKQLGDLAGELLAQTAMEHLGFGGVRALPQTNAERLDWFADQLVEEHRTRLLLSSPPVVLKTPSQRENPCLSEIPPLQK